MPTDKRPAGTLRPVTISISKFRKELKESSERINCDEIVFYVVKDGETKFVALSEENLWKLVNRG